MGSMGTKITNCVKSTEVRSLETSSFSMPCVAIEINANDLICRKSYYLEDATIDDEFFSLNPSVFTK